MTQEARTPVEELADRLIARGIHPTVIRRRLAERGIRWGYAYNRHQGLRERLRRLRQSGRGLCSECHQNSYPLGAAVNVCQSCLERKWTE